MIDSAADRLASEPLWKPSAQSVAHTNLTRYVTWLAKRNGLSFTEYPALWAWSTHEPEAFWSSLADYFGIQFHERADTVLSSAQMPGAHWFSGATLNYAEHALRAGSADPNVVVIYETEAADGAIRREEMSRWELRRMVRCAASALRAMGVTKGDRVAGYLPNSPPMLVAFLACASIGAIWTNCSLEMTSRPVLDRFRQVAPKVLLASTQYRYGGGIHERARIVEEIVAGLASVEHLVLVGPEDEGSTRQIALPSHASVCQWDDLLSETDPADLDFEPVEFEHPLWILYSSGTTGPPKAIVHGHGGILLEHMKALSLHLDLRDGDRFFWHTTSGWMMWNFLVSGLLLPGVAIILYDGSARHPDGAALWDIVERNGVSYFGAGAPYFVSCRAEGVNPGKLFELSRLRGIGSTGAPLPADAFVWIYETVKRDVVLGSISGGTDVCTAFVLCNPNLPVYAGKLQCVGLGAKIEAWDDSGQNRFGEVGELVLTAPFPTMPVCLWNDPDGSRMLSSYFEKFPGIWRHGDWIEIESTGGPCIIFGRSDATLNRGGVRMGTVEFYSVLEAMPEIADALVIDTSELGREGRLLLFVVLHPGVQSDPALRDRIIAKLRSEVSPRHVPDAIIDVPSIPRTLNGKKLEVPVKRILAGMSLDAALDRGAVANPESLETFRRLAAILCPPNQ